MIKFNNLKETTVSYHTQLTEAAARVIGSGWFVHGPECKAFEAEFADYIGAKHMIGVASGTDALEIALRAVITQKGGKVATVANAGFDTATAAFAAGFEPVYVDIDPSTRLMSASDLKRVIEAHDISAVVVTHLYGLCADMAEFQAICEQHRIPLIEDCAQAHGARRDGSMAGSYGDVSTFSFYPTKNLGAIGDGGAIATASAKLETRIRQLKQYGWSDKYTVGISGGRNSRLDEIQAAMLRIRLQYLDDENSRRREIASRYSSEITSSKLTTPPVFGAEYVGHLYVVECDERDALKAYLTDAGIGVDIHFPIPDHLQPAYLEGAASTNSSLPYSEQSSKRCLSLPCYPGMSDADVSTVIRIINEW